MKIGSRRFEPRWWAAALYLTIAVAMLGLGRWQLQRADEKIALLESAARARTLPAVALEGVEDIVAAAADHRRVRLVGSWEGERQLLWDNRAHAGRAGYEVITPFRLPDGRLALVNRGWTLPGATRAREALPDVSLPDAVTGVGAGGGAAAGAGTPIVLEGLLSRPSQGFSGGAALDTSPPDEGPWPRILQHFDYTAVAAALGEPIVEAVVQAQVADEDGPYGTVGATDAAEATGATGAVVGTALDAARPELLTPNWRPASSGPEKHYGYAFQWFAMAAALTVIFVTVNLRREQTR